MMRTNEEKTKFDKSLWHIRASPGLKSLCRRIRNRLKNISVAIRCDGNQLPGDVVAHSSCASIGDKRNRSLIWKYFFTRVFRRHRVAHMRRETISAKANRIDLHSICAMCLFIVFASKPPPHRMMKFARNNRLEKFPCRASRRLVTANNSDLAHTHTHIKITFPLSRIRFAYILFLLKSDKRRIAHIDHINYEHRRTIFQHIRNDSEVSRHLHMTFCILEASGTHARGQVAMKARFYSLNVVCHQRVRRSHTHNFSLTSFLLFPHFVFLSLSSPPSPENKRRKSLRIFNTFAYANSFRRQQRKRST